MAAVEPITQKRTGVQYVYPFSSKLAIPPLDIGLLGGKGKNLAEMASIGLPVPPGLIITTEACNAYRRNDKGFPKGMKEEVRAAMQVLEGLMSAKFGDPSNPLLVSVRSGARASMPGMMDTVLNIGLNDETVEGFAKLMNNPHLAYDSYRRLITMYSEIVDDMDRRPFQKQLDALIEQEGVEEESDLSVEGLKSLCRIYKEMYQREMGRPFPQKTEEQLFGAIAAVFDSWDTERATLYRKIHRIPDDWGTGVTVQAMVFGNKNEHSATGVGFTRDPATGTRKFYGEFLINAQGEEVVAGIRTPHPLNVYQKKVTQSELASLEEIMPEAYKDLTRVVEKLEKHYRDMQDIEFTIDDGRLFMLQTRTGKRTGFAAVQMALDMLEEGLIDEETAVIRIDPEQLVQLLAPIFDQAAKSAASDKLAAKGLNAGPGAASGRIAFTSKQAVAWKAEGIRSILVRHETNPNDFPGMVASEGILTVRGGSTSHAAVVARGMGKPCIVGCGELKIDREAHTVSSRGLTLWEGDEISIDGTTGEVYFCGMETSPSEIVQVLVTKSLRKEESRLYRDYDRLMRIADKYRTLKVRTNADTERDVKAAIAFGAEGIGLTRTEHMFMDEQRLLDVRRMFFSTDQEEKQRAIQSLLPHQKSDFIQIFRALNGRPVTIRLLDPPLHEFLPHNKEQLEALSNAMQISYEELKDINERLHEHNPMLGHRGCRLGIIHPNITRMQAQAILEAGLEVDREGIDVKIEIMIPLISTESEFLHQKSLIDLTAKELFERAGRRIDYSVGTMIELPRAALTADEIAKEAEFFSFGTNDLTQTTFGISRDDGVHFVPLYIEGVKNPAKPEEIIQIFKEDPFQTLDQKGVGRLMELAVELGRKTRKDLKCGICGEHGGDPRAVEFCNRIGIDYVSCSPYRVPVARLAAAQAAIKQSRKKPN